MRAIVKLWFTQTHNKCLLRTPTKWLSGSGGTYETLHIIASILENAPVSERRIIFWRFIINYGHSKKVTTSPVSFVKLDGDNFKRRVKTKRSPIASPVFNATKNVIIKNQLTGASSMTNSPTTPMITSGPSAMIAY